MRFLDAAGLARQARMKTVAEFIFAKRGTEWDARMSSIGDNKVEV